MLHYFFRTVTIDGVENEAEGIFFDTLQAAQTDAQTSLFEMITDDLNTGQTTKLVGIHIVDGAGIVLATVKVGTALAR